MSIHIQREDTIIICLELLQIIPRFVMLKRYCNPLEAL